MILALLLAAELAGPPTAQDYVTKREALRLADRMADHGFWLGMSSSADLFSTALSLKRCPGCVEANPLGFDVEARVALKLAFGTTALGACWKLEKSGHHKTALVVRWGAVALFGYATAINTLHAVRRR